MTAHIVDHHAPSGQPAQGVAAAAAHPPEFMEALIAAGALLAYADGEMAATERRRLLQLVRENAALSVFSRRQIVDELAAHEANFAFDPEVAQVLAREKLTPMAGKAQLGRLILQACRQIVVADGVMHPAEARVLAELVDFLGVDAAQRSGTAS